ncbi:hypothetical protein T484DRAFT_1781011, partial [Baffinella frigidus]
PAFLLELVVCCPHLSFLLELVVCCPHPSFLLELVVCGLHVPPYVTFEIVTYSFENLIAYRAETVTFEIVTYSFENLIAVLRY